MTTYLDPHLIVRTDADDRPAVAGADPDPGDRPPRSGAARRHRARAVAGRAPRASTATCPRLDRDALHDLVQRVRLRGRGGAAFPFATKLEALRRGSAAGARGEHERGRARRRARTPALALTRPHLVLDGAVAAGRALHARELHVVLPGDRPAAATAMRTALAERDDPLPRALARRRPAVRRRAGQGGGRAALRPAEPAGDVVAAGRRVRSPGAADPAQQRRDLGPARAAGAARGAGVRRGRHPRRARRGVADPEPAGVRPGGPGGAVREPAAGVPHRLRRTAGPPCSAGSTGRGRPGRRSPARGSR